ncbi:MAG TPA: DUF2243 domain-containing protein [Gemmatimonadaceae bacterium]|jgi:uncharacterized membrane protein|nr:DUF2243 domain-containing protein [Gemmatimonadaceae bacterium]
MSRDDAPTRAGIVLGAGLGGFVDGILLHQILEWHNMGSAVLPPITMDAMRTNMRWDGLFHAVVWVLTLVGVFRLLMAAQAGVPIPSTRAFTGQLLTGWGLFNLIEGVIDHHVLNLHHVRDLPVHVPLYDWLFLVVCGLGFTALGVALARESISERTPRP